MADCINNLYIAIIYKWGSLLPSEKNLRIQQELREWADISDWSNPFAVTLTFKSHVKLRAGSQTPGAYLNNAVAHQNFRHFMNILNKQFFGNAAERFGKRLRVIPVLEGTATKRTHYHAVIECPDDDLRLKFPSMIETSWLQTDWGNKQINVQADANSGWIDYITKFRDKYALEESVDWNNLHEYVEKRFEK